MLVHTRDWGRGCDLNSNGGKELVVGKKGLGAAGGGVPGRGRSGDKDAQWLQEGLRAQRAEADESVRLE